jgi:release factor glutamine methyltransferase
MTAAEAVRLGAARLDGLVDNPRLESRILLAQALGVTRTDLIRDPDRAIDPAAFMLLLDRRAAHEPVAHILGHREFWSLDFQVSPATLIPRPDSETLIEAAVDAFASRQPPKRLLDLGTGTGCLLLALLTEFPAAFGIGTDIQPGAATLARDNAVRLGLAGRSAFLAASWASALDGRFDLIVSNPPYIPGGDIGRLMPEVAKHEPRSALDGGSDGLDAYRTILPLLARHLGPDGIAILEFGIGQSEILAPMARDQGFGVTIRPDLANIPRAMILRAANR